MPLGSSELNVRRRAASARRPTRGVVDPVDMLRCHKPNVGVRGARAWSVSTLVPKPASPWNTYREGKVGLQALSRVRRGAAARYCARATFLFWPNTKVPRMIAACPGEVQKNT
jgi:hypothetical protein